MRDCPVCGAGPERSELFLEERLNPGALNAFSFASRKIPEFMNHRLVRCLECDLVYVADPPPASELAAAYHVAEYDSAEEAEDAARTYMRALAPTLARLPRKRRALEIGTGTGVLLESLRAAGFAEAIGVEPSAAAIAAAPPHRRGWIREGVFAEADFEPESFDLICCFMTMEHVPDPGAVAVAARRLLAPDGAFVTVTHDYRGLVNRVLGRRSPIIDVEHMQIFSRAGIARLLRERGFREVTARPLVNRYALAYWVRLSPLGPAPKARLQGALRAVRAAGLRIPVNVGNVIAAGVK